MPARRSVAAWGAVAGLALASGLGLPAAWAAPPGPMSPLGGGAVQADELILQFKRPPLQAALRQAASEATGGGPAPATVQRALDALGQRQGVALHYLQTLGVGAALVAVTPAAFSPAALEHLVQRLAADAEVASVEVNARMTPFKPPR